MPSFPHSSPRPRTPEDPPPTQAVVLPPTPGDHVGPAASACLVMLAGPGLGRKFALDAPRVVLGRSPECGIPLEEESVSRAHAEIARTPAGHHLRDLGSTNGTRRNDQKVTSPELLADGDVIGLGRIRLKYLSGTNLEHAYHEEIRRQANLDGLTQVANRRHFDEQLALGCAQARRLRQPLALILFDLDHFKRINDVHGHPAGDEVLRTVAATVRAGVRTGDLLARYGGEEFALLLPQTGLTGARQVAEKIRAAVADHGCRVGTERLAVTISVGVAAHETGEGDGADLVRRADEQLYAAKRGGRNRVSG